MDRGRPTAWCAAVTPLDGDGHCDVPRLVGHLNRVLADGCAGAVLFGTTGEGASFTVDERLAAMDGVLAAGVPAGRLLLGCIDTALPHTITAARAAIRWDLRGVVVTPPFYYKDAGEDGITAAYRHLIETVGDDRLRLVLYHIPQVTGVGIPVRVAHALLDRYPGVVAGFKDSAGDADTTAAHVAALADRLDLFVGYEPHVPMAVVGGGAGAISGLANVMPQALRQLVDKGSDAVTATLERVADRFQRHPLIPAIKAALAETTGDPQWRRCRPPYTALPEADSRVLAQDLTPLLQRNRAA